MSYTVNCVYAGKQICDVSIPGKGIETLDDLIKESRKQFAMKCTGYSHDILETKNCCTFKVMYDGKWETVWSLKTNDVKWKKYASMTLLQHNIYLENHRLMIRCGVFC